MPDGRARTLRAPRPPSTPPPPRRSQDASHRSTVTCHSTAPARIPAQPHRSPQLRDGRRVVLPVVRRDPDRVLKGDARLHALPARPQTTRPAASLTGLQPDRPVHDKPKAARTIIRTYTQDRHPHLASVHLQPCITTALRGRWPSSTAHSTATIRGLCTGHPLAATLSPCIAKVIVAIVYLCNGDRTGLQFTGSW